MKKKKAVRKTVHKTMVGLADCLQLSISEKEKLPQTEKKS